MRAPRPDPVRLRAAFVLAVIGGVIAQPLQTEWVKAKGCSNRRTSSLTSVDWLPDQFVVNTPYFLAIMQPLHVSHWLSCRFTYENATASGTVVGLFVRWNHICSTSAGSFCFHHATNLSVVDSDSWYYQNMLIWGGGLSSPSSTTLSTPNTWNPQASLQVGLNMTAEIMASTSNSAANVYANDVEMSIVYVPPQVTTATPPVPSTTAPTPASTTTGMVLPLTTAVLPSSLSPASSSVPPASTAAVQSGIMQTTGSSSFTTTPQLLTTLAGQGPAGDSSSESSMLMIVLVACGVAIFLCLLGVAAVTLRRRGRAVTEQSTSRSKNAALPGSDSTSEDSVIQPAEVRAEIIYNTVPDTNDAEAMYNTLPESARQALDTPIYHSIGLP